MTTVDVLSLASWNADLIARVPRPPKRGETLMADGFTTGPGGKGSNAAVACARQGARVAVVARVGADAHGRMGLELWAREGIDTSHVDVAADEPSGVALIWVYDDGDNSIAVAPGAGAGLGPRHVEAAQALLTAAKVVMAPNEVPAAATLEAFRRARAAGVTTLLNPAPARELPAELLALTDVLTPNETELRALAGLADGASVADAATAVLQRGIGAVVVTLGAEGAALYRAGQAPVRVAAHRVDVVDTIGAGDTCTGALAAALARGLPLADAMGWANAAAACAVTGAGAIAAMPTLAQAERRLRSA